MVIFLSSYKNRGGWCVYLATNVIKQVVIRPFFQWVLRQNAKEYILFSCDDLVPTAVNCDISTFSAFFWIKGWIYVEYILFSWIITCNYIVTNDTPAMSCSVLLYGKQVIHNININKHKHLIIWPWDKQIIAADWTFSVYQLIKSIHVQAGNTMANNIFNCN